MVKGIVAALISRAGKVPYRTPRIGTVGRIKTGIPDDLERGLKPLR
jgi:hypothetical protein